MEWIMRRRQVFLLRRLARRMLRRDPRVTTEPNLRGKVMRTSKRSIIIAGAQTSVSLEDEFWEALKEIANERGTRVSDLVKSIKADGTANLSSAVRLFVLGYYQDQIFSLQKNKQRQPGPDLVFCRSRLTRGATKGRGARARLLAQRQIYRHSVSATLAGSSSIDACGGRTVGSAVMMLRQSCRHGHCSSARPYVRPRRKRQAFSFFSRCPSAPPSPSRADGAKPSRGTKSPCRPRRRSARSRDKTCNAPASTKVRG